MTNSLAMLELCAFYIEYKKEEIMTIDFRGRTIVKYFIKTHLLRFC